VRPALVVQLEIAPFAASFIYDLAISNQTKGGHMSLQTKLASKLKYNKSNQGTNGLMVRDSHWYAIGALIGFINPLVLLCIISILTITMLSLSTNIVNTYAASSSITVTIDDSTIDLNVAPTGQGAFSKSSVSTIGISTTNATGYTLKMAAQEGDNPTALVNGSDNTKTLSSIGSALTEAQFKALDATSYNNMWGYLPSNLCTTNANSTNNTTSSGSTTSTTCTTNTSFLPSPTTEGDTLDITDSANAIDHTTGQAIVNEYEITLGARVDTTASLGSYSNVFLVDVVANAIPYSFIYNDNVVSNVPTDLNSTTMNSSENISSNTPVRDGYTFLGWCLGTSSTTNITNTNGVDTCSSTTYQPGAAIAIDQTGEDNDKYFYAMWSKNKSIEDLNYMQDFASLSSSEKSSVLNSMTTGQKYFLFDNRDMEAYALAKLKDGNVWMLDNLRLGSTSTMALTAANTNSNGSYTLPAGITSGFNSFVTAQINVVYKNNTTTGYGQGSSKIGVYYNYCAASAGTYCYAQNAGTGNASYDICPKGWRLPTGGSGGEYNTLHNYYNTTQTATEVNSLQYNLSVALSGEFGSTQTGLGQRSTFYTSTFGDTQRMDTIPMTSTSVRISGTTSSRYFGLSIRCIANNE